MRTWRLASVTVPDMTSTVTNNVKAAALIALALAIGAMGFYVAEADDAPGAAAIGLLLMAGAVVLAVKAARNRLPAWAAHAALAVGVLIAGFAAFLTHAVAVTAPLFAQPQDVPSVIDSAPPAQYAAAVQRARELVRAAVLEQKLPGVSVAVGAGLPPAASVEGGGTIVWAEGFGWRDVDTRTPVTAEYPGQHRHGGVRRHCRRCCRARADAQSFPAEPEKRGVAPEFNCRGRSTGGPGETR